MREGKERKGGERGRLKGGERKGRRGEGRKIENDMKGKRKEGNDKTRWHKLPKTLNKKCERMRTHTKKVEKKYKTRRKKLPKTLENQNEKNNGEMIRGLNKEEGRGSDEQGGINAGM